MGALCILLDYHLLTSTHFSAPAACSREICEAASQQRPRPNQPPIQVLFLLESWTPPPSVQAGRVVRVNEAVMRKLAGVETAHRIDAVGLLTKPANFVSFLDVQTDESEGHRAGQNGSGGEASGSGRREEGRTEGLCSQPSCYMSPQEWCPTATHVVALDGIQVSEGRSEAMA